MATTATQRTRYRPQTGMQAKPDVQAPQAPDQQQSDPMQSTSNASQPFDPTQLQSPINDGAYGAASGAQGVHDYENQANQNQTNSNARGNTINSTTANQAADYTQQANSYRNQADAAYGNLAQTPGYSQQEQNVIGQDYGANKTTQGQFDSEQLTGNEQNAITGNSRSDMQYYNPTLLTGETQTANSNLGAATSNLQNGLNNSFDPTQLSQSQGYQDTLNSATAAQTKGIGSAIGHESNALNASVDPSRLGVASDYAAKEGLTPQQQQDMVTAAGTTVGNSTQAAEDQLKRSAQASGNSSPEAIAAANQRLQLQGAGAAGDAMTNARIAASNAAAGREQTIQSTELGANEDIANRQENNASTIGGQGINAANAEANTQIGVGNNLESSRVGDQQDIANRQMTAATIGGQAGINTANTQGQNTLSTDRSNQAVGQNLEQTAEATDSSRAAQIAGNRQATQVNQDNTKYSQGMGTQAANSQGQQTIGNANIAGQNSYRNYLTGEQGTAQQGQQTATGQQIQNYGVQSGAANTATGIGANLANGQANRPTTTDQIIGGISGAASGLASFLEDGGVATQPTLAVLGENGPEKVVPLDPNAPANPSNAGAAPQPNRYRAALNGIQTAMQKQSPTRYQATQPSAVPGQMGANIGSAVGKIASTLAGRGTRYGGESREDADDTGAVDAVRYEDGGIATSPTLAVLGENEPEKVQPLSPNMQSPQGTANASVPQPTFNGVAPTSQGMAQDAPPPDSGMQSTMQQPMQPDPSMQSQQSYSPPPAAGGKSLFRPPRYGGQTSQQPQMYASGGIITKPTLAIVGEHGPEAVVPMNPKASSKITPSMMGPGATLPTAGRQHFRYPSIPQKHGLHALNTLKPSPLAR